MRIPRWFSVLIVVAVLAACQPKPTVIDECFWRATVEVWEDTDGDGVHDPGELPLKDIRVITLYEGADEPRSEDRTGPEGTTEVGAISQACDWENYYVSIVVPAGYEVPTDMLVAFSEVGNSETIQFGLHPTEAAQAATPTAAPHDVFISAYAEHPCTLIEPEEIRWLLAATLDEDNVVEETETDSETGALTGICTYGDLAMVTLIIPGPAQDPMESFKANLPPDAEEIETRGDVSYWHEASRTMSVFTRNVWFTVEFLISALNYDNIRAVPDVATIRLNGEDPAVVASVPADPPENIPCPLISHEEAEVFLGALIYSSAGGPMDLQDSECTFTRDDPARDSVYLAYFYHRSAQAAQTSLQETRAAKAADPSLVLDDETSIGDTAFWEGWGAEDAVGVLHVVQGTVSLSVGTGEREEMIRLAEALLGRLAETASPEGAAPSFAEFADCDVLTRQQAESVLGPLNGDPFPLESIGGTGLRSALCIFEGTLNSAHIGIGWYRTSQEARASYAQSIGEPVTGIGDAAVWDGQELRLSVLRGNVQFSVLMIVSDGARDQAIQLGQIAVVRIP